MPESKTRLNQEDSAKIGPSNLHISINIMELLHLTIAETLKQVQNLSGVTLLTLTKDGNIAIQFHKTLLMVRKL